MPIVGLTDTGAALPKVGTLRKGGPKPDERHIGPDLKHLRFTSDDPEMVKRFTDAYGDQPKEVNVFFLFNDIDDIFSAWREHWLAGGLQHRCDGQTCVLWLDPKTNEYKTDTIPCPDKDKPDKQKRCKPIGRLSVLIPELQKLATVSVLTSSKHDIMSIQQSLEAAKLLQQNKLAGIPFILCRKEREISTPGDGNKRARRKKSLLFIEPAHRYAIQQLRSMDVTLALPPGTSDDDDDDNFVDQATGEIHTPVKPATNKKTLLVQPQSIDEPPPPDDDEAEDGLFTEEPTIQPERAPEGPALSHQEADEAIERADLLAQIVKDRQKALISEPQLHQIAKRDYKVERYHELEIADLRALAARVEQARRNKEVADGQ